MQKWLVGAWRGARDSDVDIVLLTETPGVYVDDAEWARPLGAVEVLRTQRWGVLTERRMALGSGLVVEFGVVTPAWASTAPLDDGTARVLTSRRWLSRSTRRRTTSEAYREIQSVGELVLR